MYRSVLMVRNVALCCVLSVLALTGCGREVRGTPGGDGVRDPYFPKAGNGGYDVSHYDLTLAYDPDRRHLTGTAVITARAVKNLSAFNLDLKGLEVRDVTVEGRKASFSRAGQELTVRPREDLMRGETFEVTVRYAGRPQTVVDPDGEKEGWLPTDDGAVALGQPVGSMAWFPGNNHPSDKAAYDISITVPEGFQAVSNGELKSETTSGGRRTFHWHMAEPMASYLATVAVGRFEITRSTMKNGLPVYIAVDPTQAEASRAVLARIPEITQWAERKFGPYPFSSTGAIVDPARDGFYALETQTRPVYPGAPNLDTVVHEIAHQWYGNSVSPKSWQDMWLNEAFATYAEWLWAEEHGGSSAQQIFDELYRDEHYPDEDHNKAVWEFPPGRPSSAAHISDPPVYDRGAMVLHKIRQTVGDDAFHDIVRGWAAAHRHGNASTDDFIAYVERKAPDKDFDGIWKDWLYGEGKPARP